MENYIINTILTIFFIGFILCRYFYAKWFIDNNLYPHANLIRDNRLKKNYFLQAISACF